MMRDIQSSSKRANRACWDTQRKGRAGREGERERGSCLVNMWDLLWIFCCCYLKFIVCENALKLNFLLAFVAYNFSLPHINQCDKSFSPSPHSSTSSTLSLFPLFVYFSFVLFVFFFWETVELLHVRHALIHLINQNVCYEILTRNHKSVNQNWPLSRKYLCVCVAECMCVCVSRILITSALHT